MILGVSHGITSYDSDVEMRSPQVDGQMELQGKMCRVQARRYREVELG